MNISRLLQCVACLSLATGLITAHAREKKYHCNFNDSDEKNQPVVVGPGTPYVTHSLDIGVRNNRISSFSYTSVTNDEVGYMCDIGSARGDGESTWRDVPGGVLVRTEDPYGRSKNVYEIIQVKKRASGYELRILHRPDGVNLECGAGSYLADKIALVPGSKMCRLN